MNADQVIEGIGKVVAAAKPAQEYCFLWIDWWPMCMTKSEWSGWAQAIGTFAAIVFALAVPYFQNTYRRARTYLLASQCLAQLLAVCASLAYEIERGRGAKDALAGIKPQLDSLLATMSEVRIEELPMASRHLWWTAQDRANHLVALRDSVGADKGFAKLIIRDRETAITCVINFKDYEPRIFGLRVTRMWGLAL